MSAPRIKRLGKMSIMAFADRKKFEGVEKSLRTDMNPKFGTYY